MEVEVVASDQGIFVDSFSSLASHPQRKKVDDDRRQYVEKTANNFKESAMCQVQVRKGKESNVVPVTLQVSTRGQNETHTRLTESVECGTCLR